MGNRLVIEAAADSWAALCAKVKPTFTWKGRDLIWVETNAQGMPFFRLNCAYLYETSQRKPQWVLLEIRNGEWDEWYGQVMGDNLKGGARVQPEKPKSDHGSGDYAITLAENERHGTVYEVGWQRVMANGTGHAEVERRLYLLRNPFGSWTFLGEGPEESRGKTGGRRGSSTASTPQVVWVQTNEMTCRIYFAIEERGYEWASDDDPPGKLRKDLVLYEDMVLGAGSQRLRRLTCRPYLRVAQGDTLGALVEHLSSWTLGWETGGKDERQNIERVWRQALFRLNPSIDFEDLIPGTKMAVLTYAETVELLRKTAEPTGSANGSQPIRSETNRTPPAAGSRR
ncbi:MAG: hypothetical protein ACLQU3_28800 [Limisphaerales bacterium]